MSGTARTYRLVREDRDRMTVVVDGSVTVKWVIPEVLSDKADALRGWADHLVAPDFALAP